MSGETDRLYSGAGGPVPFEFNREVARVFDDMISRSVPMYREVTRAVVDWAERFYKPGTEIYDLGCSTGTAIEAMARRFSARQQAARFVGIELGILIGVGASLAWFVVRTTRPHTAVLGRLPMRQAIESNAAQARATYGSPANPIDRTIIQQAEARLCRH